ncbi:hypothetical protein BDW67DRAFT_185755 [Aspergillus spinulosporus]
MAKQPSFLRLPYEIRLRIYTLLCMVDPYPSHIRSFEGEWSAREQQFIDDSIVSSDFSNQLFYVSRAISEDARAAFYSVNTLHFYKMQDLLNLTPVAWKSLRSICVTIGMTRCEGSHHPLVYRAHQGGCHGTVAEIMENDTQLLTNADLEAWRSICSTLADYKQDVSLSSVSSVVRRRQRRSLPFWLPYMTFRG